MVRPTQRFVKLLAAGVAVAALPAVLGPRASPGWILALTAGAVAMGVDVWRLPSHRAIEVKLVAPRQLPVGRRASASIEVFVPARDGLTVDVLADLSADFAPQPLRTVAVTDAQCRVELPLVPLQRGQGAVESLWLRIPGPWGLAERTTKIPVGHSIDVLPNVRGDKTQSLHFEEGRAGRGGTKVERFDGEGSEFDALREFRVGDDQRTIDWKSSARHGVLLRRQFRAERDHQVVFALDSGRLMAARLHGIPKLDHAVGAALRLALVALRTGDRVGVYGFDESPRIRVVPQGGLGAHARLVRALATLQAREVETNFTLGLMTLLQSLRRRSLVLVLTDFADTVSAELMIENLRRVGRRHVVVFVALADPALEAIASEPPLDRRAIHRAVVAGTIRRERATVLERLRHMGIHPLEASAERLGAEMISRYLDLKRREVA